MKTRPSQPLAGGSLRARCARVLRGALSTSRRDCSLRERTVSPWDGPAARLRFIPPSLFLAFLLAACGSAPPQPSVERRPEIAPSAASPAPSFEEPATAPKKPPPAAPWVLKKGGGFYKDDGPGDNPPEDLDAIADAVPRAEPLHRFANNPYSVFGRDYVPRRTAGGYKVRGIASWYGKKFHGQKTSSGEAYDMYGMTAAHPTLPIPSYARVSNPTTGKAVVVRINDRGPFHADRVIDLSWTAAAKLGYIGSGSTLVEVESLTPGQSAAAPADDDPIARLAQAPAREPPRNNPALAAVAEGGSHYLQLGAFGNRDNAEALHARLVRQLGEFAEKLVIRQTGSLHRVQLGPWADAPAARRAAESLRQVLDFAPVVVPR